MIGKVGPLCPFDHRWLRNSPGRGLLDVLQAN